jgi:iron(III) transport system substrate-binding protein
MKRLVKRGWLILVLVAVIATLVIWNFLRYRQLSDRVVVACAQDEEYAELLFKDLAPKSKLQITPKYDTEANKSVSLVAELMEEKDRPRTDLHWNNEPLGTIRLARAGMYEADSWKPFAERARVLIVNTTLVKDTDRPTSIFDLTDPKWKGRAAMAKPYFGTTASHIACLWEMMGQADCSAFLIGLKTNDVALVAGNKTVARNVAAGKYAFGLTDSDDAALEVLDGKPVVIVFPDAVENPKYPRLGTLFLPNTIAVIKNGPNPGGARTLKAAIIDSEAVLAAGGGYQFPTQPDVPGPTLPCLQPWKTTRRMKADFEKAVSGWEMLQHFLRDQFAR